MNGARALSLYGTPELPSPLRRLVAGPLSALLDGGSLRTIRFGDYRSDPRHQFRGAKPVLGHPGASPA